MTSQAMMMSDSNGLLVHIVLIIRLVSSNLVNSDHDYLVGTAMIHTMSCIYPYTDGYSRTRYCSAVVEHGPPSTKNGRPGVKRLPGFVLPSENRRHQSDYSI